MGSGRFVSVPNGPCATCGQVRGNANTRSAHHGGCKRAQSQLGYFDSAKIICFYLRIFFHPIPKSRLSGQRNDSSFFFFVANHTLRPPGPSPNLGLLRRIYVCQFFNVKTVTSETATQVSALVNPRLRRGIPRKKDCDLRRKKYYNEAFATRTQAGT